MTCVIPTILEPTRSLFRARVDAIKPHFTRAQIDVLNNTSVLGQSCADPIFIEALKTHLTFEIDLMVDMDTYDVAQWNKSWVDKIIFHVESSTKHRKLIQAIKSWGKKVFLSINPETDVELLTPFLSSVDGVLFLGVHPGKSGNPFVPEVLDTIQRFHKRHLKIEIEVDGGVTNETMPALFDVGVSEFAIGSYLQNDQVEERLFSLIPLIERHETKVKLRKK